MVDQLVVLNNGKYTPVPWMLWDNYTGILNSQLMDKIFRRNTQDILPKKPVKFLEFLQKKGTTEKPNKKNKWCSTSFPAATIWKRFHGGGGVIHQPKIPRLKGSCWYNRESLSSWWFQSTWKIWVKMSSSSPSNGEHKTFFKITTQL